MNAIVVILLASVAVGCAGRDAPATGSVEAQGGEYVPIERNATRLGNRRVGVRVGGQGGGRVRHGDVAQPLLDRRRGHRLLHEGGDVHELAPPLRRDLDHVHG